MSVSVNYNILYFNISYLIYEITKNIHNLKRSPKIIPLLNIILKRIITSIKSYFILQLYRKIINPRKRIQISQYRCPEINTPTNKYAHNKHAHKYTITWSIDLILEISATPYSFIIYFTLNAYLKRVYSWTIYWLAL